MQPVLERVHGDGIMAVIGCRHDHCLAQTTSEQFFVIGEVIGNIILLREDIYSLWNQIADGHDIRQIAGR